MAVFLAISSREIISKIVAIWFPVMCFVGLRTDHVIANMVLHLEEHDSGVAGQYCGRWLFCGAVYWYLFLEGEEVEIHFDEMGDGRKDVCPFAENKMMTWNESCKLIFYSPSVPMTEHITNTNLRMTNGHINGHSHSKQDIHPNEPSNRPLWNSGTIAVTGFAKDYQERDCGRKIGGRVGGTTA
ncbi:hypothetical protein DL95DRAFT_412233 [Leptodontidium sp. 2 PMI_412]|nr:hypothetical protein DL95DRAFT_412233 [Leptodontidium sp. 2 PMI_412]